MIKNLIFDVGGVLIGYRWKEMLMEDFGLSDDKAEEVGQRIFEDPIWRDFDRGVVHIDKLVGHYCTLYPEDADIFRRVFYGNDRMATEREAVWEKMEELKKKGYNIYILSNYSEYLFKKHTDPLPFRNLLDGGVVSYQAGAIKPEAEIYTHLLKKYGLDPEECIFFDDIEANVEAARNIGITSRHITSEEALLKELESL
ncbi:MAG: HAD family phosphatase [Lachnospiraceae bacterium]|nr:HAD family phosphatase [Lachnospiraceae bacterium]